MMAVCAGKREASMRRRVPALLRNRNLFLQITELEMKMDPEVPKMPWRGRDYVHRRVTVTNTRVTVTMIDINSICACSARCFFSEPRHLPCPTNPARLWPGLWATNEFGNPLPHPLPLPIQPRRLPQPGAVAAAVRCPPPPRGLFLRWNTGSHRPNRSASFEGLAHIEQNKAARGDQDNAPAWARPKRRSSAVAASSS